MISGDIKKNIKQIKGNFERNIPKTSLKNILKLNLHPSVSGVRIGHFYWILGSHLDGNDNTDFGGMINQQTIYRKTFLWNIPKFKWISGMTVEMTLWKMEITFTIF